MGRSRRKYKKSRPKVRVGLPKKYRVFKPAFTVPDELLLHSAAGDADGDGSTTSSEKEVRWDEKGSVNRNYSSLGVVANPNLLSVRARTTQTLHIPRPAASAVAGEDPPGPLSEFDPIDSGSDLETDDLKSALGKRRRDGKTAPPQPLTRIQRVHVGRLVLKYGDDYQAMFMDTKLNTMQHSVDAVKKLCQRYHHHAANRKLIIKHKGTA